MSDNLKALVIVLAAVVAVIWIVYGWMLFASPPDCRLGFVPIYNHGWLCVLGRDG